jgi:mono/diheme cytochrome c family protein
LSFTGCGSGSGGSDVGSQPRQPPVAEAAIVGHDNLEAGGAVSAVVRSGSEVVLAAVNSYGTDGPIVSFEWTATNPDAQALDLITRSSNSKSFTAPFVSAPTALDFTLTVTDADNQSDSTDVVVTVEPFPDPNRFLTYLRAPSTFDVIAATNDQLTADTAFEVSVQLRVTYPDRLDQQQIYEGPVVTRSSSWLASVGSDADTPTYHGNPRLTFDVPQIDLDDINLPYVNQPPGHPDRNLILELNRIGEITSEVAITLTPAAGDPSQAALFLPDASQASPATAGGVLAKLAKSKFTGVAQEITLPLEELVAQPADPSAQPYESSLTAGLYYQTIDPDGERLTLTNWLVENCFDPSDEVLAADAHAIYTNNFDLGFGRDMYVKNGSECSDGSLIDGDLASVVINYPSLQLAAKQIDPIIAVAMEYTAALPPFDAARTPNDRFAKFYVFAPDEGSGEMVRISSANFDGRGEKFVPGVCAVCHGGQPKPIETSGCANGGNACYADGGDVDSIFMPWDIDSFLFSGPDGDPQKDPSLPPINQPFITDDDKAVIETYTLANQEDSLRNLNQALLATYSDNAPVRRLVHDWYHDPSSSTPPDYTSNTLSGNFQSNTVADGWRNDLQDPDTDRETLYLAVIAQNCRACHTQLEQTEQIRPTFADYENFTSNAPRIEETVLRQGLMPGARLTMDRFWVDFDGDSSSAGESLAIHLGRSPDEFGGPSASIMVSSSALEPRLCDETIQVQRDDTIRFDGSESGFASVMSWELSGPANSQAALVGSDTLQPAFEPDTFGEWTVTAIARDASGQESDPQTCVVTVENATPSAPDIDNIAVIAEGGVTSSIVLLDRLKNFCPVDDELCADIFGDPDSEVSIDQASAVNGTVTVNDAATGTFVFESTAPASDGVGSFAYQITDIDGDTSTATITVTINDVPGPTANDDGSLLSRILVGANTSVVPGTSLAINVLQNDGVSDGLTLSISGFTNGVRGTVTLDNGFDPPRLRYTPNLRAIGTDTFTYTIMDNNMTDPGMDTATVFVDIRPTVTFSGNVQNALGTTMAGCLSAGCHNSGGTGPNWTSHATATGPSAFVAGNVINAPATGAQSRLLRVPITGTVDPSVGPAVAPNPHDGGANLFNANTGVPGNAAYNPNSPYSIVLRWIEEGAPNN